MKELRERLNNLTAMTKLGKEKPRQGYAREAEDERLSDHRENRECPENVNASAQHALKTTCATTLNSICDFRREVRT